MSQFGVEKAKENHPSGYPCETKFDPTADKSGVTTPQSPSSDSATQPAVLGNPAGGIAFANNVEQQRENARRQFEQGRRFDGMVDMMSRDNDMPLTDTVLDSDMDDDSRDDEAMFEEIMRQPIDKSQLTNEQKYLLGGVEYRALDMLSRIVPIYFLCMNIISAFFFRLYVACSPYAQNVLLTSNPNPVDPWFWSFFASISSFNNLGLIQLDANMSPFQSSPAPLILSAFLIVVGNTGYAIVLRFIIWVLYKLTPHDNTYRRETLRFLLDHPRRCYTTLFPATQTWWLFIILLVINIVEIVSFLVLNFWLPVLENLSWGTRVLIAFFQSVATRNGKYMALHPFPLAYPVAISMRNTNVYQACERSLGVYRGSQNDGVAFTDSELRGPAPFIKLRRHPTINSVVTQSRKLLRGPDFFVLTQIQRQLTSDICWVITGVFCICVIEARAIMSPSPITISTVIYEAVSAFGNVGASPGYPNTATSQCGQYHLLGKLVLILLMYRLPSSIDRAVLLPSEQLEQQEVEEQLLKRRNTSLTNQSSFHNAMLYTRSSTL
ncbi:cation transport protein-domain-containing protein [Dichotomocladium elegans]|nr:cation transport protein-domain-containing protein [Dichotomocladium elegans]